MNCVNFFLSFSKYRFQKKFRSVSLITRKILVYDMDLDTKIYPKFVTLYVHISKFSKTSKKLKIQMNSKKSIN